MRTDPRSDPLAVVLDRVDRVTGPHVGQRRRELASDRTAVFISHRMSTARLADCIYVLAHGKIVEQGSHEELDARGGTYATLFRLQAESYR